MPPARRWCGGRRSRSYRRPASSSRPGRHRIRSHHDAAAGILFQPRHTRHARLRRLHPRGEDDPDAGAFSRRSRASSISSPSPRSSSADSGSRLGREVWQQGLLVDTTAWRISLLDRLSQAREVATCAIAQARENGITTTAQALAYSLFLAIPSALLVVLGVFSLVASPATSQRLIDRANGVIPPEAATLLTRQPHRARPSPRARHRDDGRRLRPRDLDDDVGGDDADARGHDGVRREGRARLRPQAAARARDRRSASSRPPRSSSRCSSSARTWSGGLGNASRPAGADRLALVDGPVADARARAARCLRGAALSRPGRRAAELEARHARGGRRARDLARRLRRLLALRLALRLLRQDVGLALGRRRDADLALAHERRAAVRGRGQRREPPARGRARSRPTRRRPFGEAERPVATAGGN